MYNFQHSHFRCRSNGNDCVFKCVLGKCPVKQKLSRSQPDGAILRNIIDAIIQYGDSLHVDLQEQLDANENLQVSYHGSCINWYLTHAPESETGELCSPVKCKRRSAIPLLKFRDHCIYCGETCDKACKNPNRWVPAYLVTEVDMKEVDERGKHVTSKDRILKLCKVRADDWADVVKMRVTGAPSDLHASDARYHKDCLSRFFSQRRGQDTAVSRCEATHHRDGADRTKIYDLVGSQERFTELVGSCMTRSDLLRMLSLHADDLVILLAPGYRKVAMFHDNARATLKVTNDDDEEDNIDAALNVIVKAIKAEGVAIEYENNTYTRNISMSIAAESVSVTIQLLLQNLSWSLEAESLTSLLVGNIVTSVLRIHATPLQIALEVLINRKQIIKHMFDYQVTCSYDELRRYKKSSAVAIYTQLRREDRVPVTVSGLIQHVADTFGAGVHLLRGSEDVVREKMSPEPTSLTDAAVTTRAATARL